MATDLNLAGVSLARYAAINAALTEGFPLPDVLAIEGLSEPAWKEADAAFKVELTREPATLASYAAELAAAEDLLSRRVTPLEDDPDAWVAFLHAFSKSPEPFELLKTNGLGMNDISRLRRRWARRLEQENGLEEQLSKLARAPGALPSIQVEPAVLPRSRAAKAGQAAIIPAASQVRPSPAVAAFKAPGLSDAPAAIPPNVGSASPTPRLTLEHYARMCVEIALYPAHKLEILRRYGLDDEQQSRLDAYWGARVRGDVSVKAAWDRFYAEHWTRLREPRGR
jgi:hypothetical protein